jgi:hypothetical protein
MALSIVPPSCTMIFAYANIMVPKKARPLVATVAGSPLGATGSIPAKLRHIGEARLQALEQLRMERISRLCQRVVAPRAIPAGSDQTRSAQVRKMPRSCRLRDAERTDEVTDAQLSILQQVQNPQPGPVGERSEQSIDRQVRRLQHGLPAV